MAVLTDESNVNETKTPLDTVTDVLVNKVLPDVESGVKKNSNVRPFYYASPEFQSRKKSEYTTGLYIVLFFLSNPIGVVKLSISTNG